MPLLGVIFECAPHCDRYDIYVVHWNIGNAKIEELKWTGKTSDTSTKFIYPFTTMNYKAVKALLRIATIPAIVAGCIAKSQLFSNCVQNFRRLEAKKGPP